MNGVTEIIRSSSGRPDAEEEKEMKRNFWNFKEMGLETAEDFLGWLSSFGAQFKVTKLQTRELKSGELDMFFEFEQGVTENVIAEELPKEE